VKKKPEDLTATLVDIATGGAVQLPPKATELAVREPSPMASVNIQSLLDKAVDSKAAVDVLKELRAMYLDEQARQAERAFNEAMSAFQAECPTVIKQKEVKTNAGQVAYKYAPIEVVEQQIRPTEHRHGFNHRFDQDVDCPADFVGVKCIVNHTAGHSITTSARYRLGVKTAIMSNTQQDASAESFAKRRALANAYGLVIAGEDHDGGEKLKPAGPSLLAPDDPAVAPQARELWKLLAPVCPASKTWDERNNWLWENSVLDGAIPEAAPNLSAKRYAEVLAKVREELQ